MQVTESSFLQDKNKEIVIKIMVENQNKESAIKLKIMMIGDSAVGKTSLIHYYEKQKVTAAHISSKGIDYVGVTKKMRDGAEVKVQIWDTAGQEVYQGLTY